MNEILAGSAKIAEDKFFSNEYEPVLQLRDLYQADPFAFCAEVKRAASRERALYIRGLLSRVRRTLSKLFTDQPLPTLELQSGEERR